MKKLLSTIGLGIALMTGFAPSQAMAAITFVNNPAVPNGAFPGTWSYDLTIGEGDTFATNDYITLTTTGVINGGAAPDINWGLNLPGGGYSAIWTWTGSDIVGAAGGTTISGFSVTSLDPSGPVVWRYNDLPVAGNPTQGPVPEPATVMLLGIGGLLAGGRKLYESRTEDITA